MEISGLKHQFVEMAEKRQNFEQWFDGSKVVGPNGEPLVVFHATPKDFELSNIQSFSHFGSAAAAQGIIDRCLRTRFVRYSDMGQPNKNLKVFPVFLSIKNPLVMTDASADWAHTYYYELSRMNIFDVNELKACFPKGLIDDQAKAWKQDLINFLQRHGYDGLVYQNNVEDQGSQSYVTFGAGQVRAAIPLNNVLPRKSFYAAKDQVKPWR